MAGANWGGFYALDFYNDEVRKYLKEIFITALDEWGFDLVKFDFLYAVCLAPPPSKTRGEVMYDAMIFLRDNIGEKEILGCGVPLGSSFGLVDYCRIGCDVGLSWKGSFVDRNINREGVSTFNSIRNTIGRRHLDGRAFLNDPDVFLMREENVSLTSVEKETLFRVNVLFGSLVFTSDDLSLYSNEKHELLSSVNTSRDIISIEQEGLFYKIVYTEINKES